LKAPNPLANAFRRVEEKFCSPGQRRGVIGLSNLHADKDRNLQLLKERGWFDIPVICNNNRRAILAMEKGTPGEVWEQ
jgi:hypothetical protein